MSISLLMPLHVIWFNTSLFMHYGILVLICICLCSVCLLFGVVYTLCYKKVSHLTFDNNFGKCGPIFKILSPGDS